MLTTVLLAGCATPQPTPAPDGSPGTQVSPAVQRMRATYADLAAGRFISIADFETPGHETMFRCVGPDGTEGERPQPALSLVRSRAETGSQGLAACFTDAGDRLVCDGRRAPGSAFVRDWRDYALLIFSLHGPPEGAVLEFTIESGERDPLRWSRTIHARPGWSLQRIDLGTVGAWIDLANIRALSWQATELGAPFDIYLDDLIITDNTVHVLGEQATEGEMYVLTRGRRIVVGTRGRFELAFADGQLVTWHAGDEQNLVDPDGLGPWPIPLPPNWTAPGVAVAYDDPRHFAEWGPIVAASQRVVEATPFRVVIAGRWRFTSTPPDTPDAAQLEPASPGHAWQYTIYPSGAMFVNVRSEALEAGWPGTAVGYALGLDGRRGFKYIAPPAAEAHAQPPRYALLARPGSGRADLLWVWPEAVELGDTRSFASADDRRLAVIAGDTAARPVVTTAHLLRIWPPDIDGVPEAASFAADYRAPATIRTTTGALVTGAPGDLDGDGFNESEGAYELAPAGGVLRFDFVPGGQLRFDPVFRVRDTAGQRCWVYARGRQVKDVGRDASDNLLFHLARVASAPVAIEVHTAP